MIKQHSARSTSYRDGDIVWSFLTEDLTLWSVQPTKKGPEQSKRCGGVSLEELTYQGTIFDPRAVFPYST